MDTLRFLLDHLPGCTPLNPCVSCETTKFLRSKLIPEDFNTFIKIVRQTPPSSKENDEGSRLLAKTIEYLMLPARVSNSLAAEEIRTVGQLVQKSKRELCRFPGMGKLSLRQVDEALTAVGLSLAR
jgi:DNA-directed RNA polymerase alpha subunit